MHHLKKEGVSFVPEEFDIGKFCKAVNSMIGNWSEFIFMKMTEEICKRTGKSLNQLGLERMSEQLAYSTVLKKVVLKVGSV